MKVCHICSNYDDFFVNLMDQQIKNGIDLRVFYFRSKQRGLPRKQSSYVDVRLNYSNWHRPFFYLKEKSVLKDFFAMYNKKDFDILHAHTLFSNGYIALEAKKKWGIPYVVAVRDMDVNVFFKYRLNLRQLGIEILKEAEKVIFLSSNYKENVLSKYVPEDIKTEILEKSVVVPNGIDPFFLENRTTNLRKTTSEKKNIELITVGYVCDRKNQLTVCKAIEHMITSGYNVNYTIVGKILDQTLFRKISKYPFVNHIPFIPKEKLIEEYRKADIFVMPSKTETFGLTYIEAMTQGLPIIYTKGQGIDGYFKDGEVGYAVKSNSILEISNSILNILNKQDELSSNCVNKVSEFNWEDIALGYKDLYSNVFQNSKV